MHKIFLGILGFSFALVSSCSLNKVNFKNSNVIIPDKKIELWNGKDFNNWIKYFADKNVNADEIWKISEGIIHCTGNPIGYLRTKNEYVNYKLTVIWRWPSEPGNSGVMLHCQLPDQVWPKSIEAQLMSENAGDFYVISGSDFKELVDKESRRLEKQNKNSENTPGEWNKYEIICNDNSITLNVNNVFQNKATECTLNSGAIAFQSEGKPIEFKEIYIEPID
ncbi:MAG: DUF1080 domain-containing protein [Ignavibacteriales bacterium]|nr:DUF1080 domain-containing protein [Ignavibacteriales bacterium]